MELINKTIGQYLREQAEKYKDRPALEMGSWTCTYGQLDRISDLLAGQMEERGIRKGTHVGIWSVNSPNWVFTFLALLKTGAVPVLINTCYKGEEIKGILNYANVEVVYCGAGYKTILCDDVIAEIRDQTPGVRHFLHINEKEAGVWMNEESFPEELRSAEADRQVQERKAAVKPQDTACMIFTSGTTSLPKGVMLSHYNILNNARAIAEAMRWTSEDKLCVAVPLFHCFGITAGIVAGIVSGMSMHLIPYFKTAKVWEAIDEYRCTVLNGVPSMFLALIRKEEYAGRRADGLISGVIAGSPITPEEFEEIEGRFPRLHLQPSYGQTETSPCVTIVDWDEPSERKAAWVGKPIEHVQVRIADPSSGEVLGTIRDGRVTGAGVDGEIQVKGYNVMSGYYQLPEATRKVFTEDGWLRTGDIGCLGEGGELKITGRLKEMIIRAGENISPQEIEQAIRGLPWVEEVKVVGVPAQVLQEEVVACIVPKEGCRVDPDGLREYLKPRLAHYKIPAYVLTFDELPMNASGKIHLKRLREMAASGVERLRDK